VSFVRTVLVVVTTFALAALSVALAPSLDLDDRDLHDLDLHDRDGARSEHAIDLADPGAEIEEDDGRRVLEDDICHSFTMLPMTHGVVRWIWVDPMSEHDSRTVMRPRRPPRLL
jgi:hypothetical protein